MKKHIILLCSLIAAHLSSQTVPSSAENYVYSKTHLSKPGDAIQKPPLEVIQYFDGLGRPKQVVSVKATSKGNDLVTIIPYDGFGRQVDSYLPVSMTSINGGIQNLDPAGVVTYYTTPQNTTTKDFPNIDTNPFSHKKLENSPLDRIQQQIQVGSAWSNKPVTFGYDANTDGEVRKYVTSTTWNNNATSSDLSLALTTDTNASSGNYKANQLYKNTVTDEDGNVSIEFKNGEGQTLLVRKMLTATDKADTYYVYNEYNQLAFVLPPLASDIYKSSSAGTSVSTTDLDNLCYQYRYDGKNRLVEKKLPGKGWEYMVYDKQDRLIMTQDANMRTAGKWMITKYDQFGRPIYTGIMQGGTRSIMQSQAGNLIITESGNTTGFTQNGITVYYTNNYFTSFDTVLSVNYYDTYPSGTPFPSGNTIQGVAILTDAPAPGVYQSTKSLPTASFVKNIEEDKWTKSYTFYDPKARSIAVYSINHLGGYTKTESVLDFAGVVQKAFTYHKRLNGDAETKIEETFTYDHQNRLLVHKHKVNNETEEILAQNTYNEIGQLTQKKVGGSVAGAPLQTIDYTYNIRGWLTGINNPETNITMGTDLFGYTLRYNEPLKGLTTPDVLNNPNLQVTPRYNGNISETDWNAVEVVGSPAQALPNRYGYVYDGLNRLRAGFFQDPYTPSKGTNNEIIEEYDLNGNIRKLKRFAHKPKSATPAKIDDLTYTYTGNRVTSIADASGNSNGYEGGNALIEYDANGNMTKMPDKGISNIAYNFLNLPQEITQQNETFYSYRADGTKIKKTYLLNNNAGSTPIHSEYLDGFQYITQSAAAREALMETDDSTLRAKAASEEETFIAREEERAAPPGNSMILSFVPTAEGFYDFEKNQYIYQYKDHLGNVRVSYTKNSEDVLEVLDRNDYYPFGMNFNAMSSVFDAMGSALNYKYNGKELQETGMYDYGARFYMPDIGRWGTIDPLSELQFAYTPYSYVYGNPISFNDPTGMIGEKSGKCPPDCPEFSNAGKETQIQEVVITIPVPQKSKDSSLSWMGINSMSAFHSSQDRYATAINNSNAALATEKFEKNLAFAMGTFVMGGSNLAASAGWAAFDSWASYQKSPEELQALAIALVILRKGQGVQNLVDDATKTGSSLLSAGDALRIENAATRIGKPITVVGSRATPGRVSNGVNTLTGNISDWDYIIQGGLKNSREWSKIKNSLPGAKSVMDNTPSMIDIHKGPVWSGYPSITIYPR